eukprot:351491-Chlamydomonas_euryale.AAC.42
MEKRERVCKGDVQGVAVQRDHARGSCKVPPCKGAMQGGHAKGPCQGHAKGPCQGVNRDRRQ